MEAAYKIILVRKYHCAKQAKPSEHRQISLSCLINSVETTCTNHTGGPVVAGPPLLYPLCIHLMHSYCLCVCSKVTFSNMVSKRNIKCALKSVSNAFQLPSNMLFDLGGGGIQTFAYDFSATCEFFTHMRIPE